MLMQVPVHRFQRTRTKVGCSRYQRTAADGATLVVMARLRVRRSPIYMPSPASCFSG